jgi:pentapeptide MXKDX repeat protein
MRKFLITAGLVLAVATPALAQGMAGPSGDSMAGPSHMTNDTMKMDHKKKPKKAAMAHDSMAAPASGGMSGPSSNSMSGPGH